MAFEEDFSVFFNADGFGDAFIYTPKIGVTLSLVGIFDDAYYAEDSGEVQVAGSQPRIQYETAKISPPPAYGEIITVKDMEYQIVGIQPDGTGTTTLLLEKIDGTC